MTTLILNGTLPGAYNPDGSVHFLEKHHDTYVGKFGLKGYKSAQKAEVTWQAQKEFADILFQYDHTNFKKAACKVVFRQSVEIPASKTKFCFECVFQSPKNELSNQVMIEESVKFFGTFDKHLLKTYKDNLLKLGTNLTMDVYLKVMNDCVKSYKPSEEENALKLTAQESRVFQRKASMDNDDNKQN